MTKERFYVTTPIYYPSDKLHIGHAYTTTIADSLARWHRFTGKEVFFLTGSDEHGQKIQRIAKEKGVSPQEYVDEIVATFKQLWERLNIKYDDFVRTTEPRHHKAVQEIFKKIYANGDIYKDKYKGWYCTPCETFWIESRLEDGNCPDCGRKVELVEEESYFFKLSKYADRLLKHIKENPDFIRPESRKREMINFIESGLEDLCISRTTFDWGIPVPIDERHVIYVWFDALTNYLTAVGYPDDRQVLEKWWPADLHLVGKEIMRFHTIYWPIILMAAGEELPKTVFGHGWLLFDSDKMSKSKGNVLDPNALIDEFGVDPIRYFLLREISFGQDGNFSRRALIERTNSDLANDLGNLLNRTLSMLQKYNKGVVPKPELGDEQRIDKELKLLAAKTRVEVERLIDRLAINEALYKIWQLIARANKYVDESAPWTLAKDESTKNRLGTVMYNLLEVQRIICLLIKSFIPETAAKIWQQLGIDTGLEQQTFDDTKWGGLKPGTATKKGDPIFPRIEVEDEPESESEKPKTEVVKEASKDAEKEEKTEVEGIITIDDFAKVKLVVAQVLKAEKIKGADRLLKLQVDLGNEQRQIVAGIAKFYSPEDLINKRIIVVKNLKPVKLRGELSQGMLLAASTADGSKLELVSVSESIPPGSQVK